MQQPENQQKLSNVLPGKRVKIVGYNADTMPLKLIEMGLLPGNIVLVKRVAPLKDPIHIAVAGYELALRLDEAAHILVAETNLEDAENT